MNKKLLFTIVFAFSLLAVLAIAVGAQSIYKDADGNELLRCDVVDSIVQNETGVGFARADDDGNALTWYITSTETVGEDTVHTVAQIKTADTVTVADGVLSINKNVVPNNKIVSINFDVGGYTEIAAAQFSSAKFTNCQIMYVYIPRYVTVLGERLFREAKLLVSVDIPFDSELTDMGTYMVWRARSLREFFVPKNVSILKYEDGKNSMSDYNGLKNGAGQDFFTDCKSLKKVVFHPDNVIVEMRNAPLRNCAAEEIRLSNNLKFLGDRSFRGCSKLKTVYFGSSFEGFYSEFMFYNCSNLEALYLPATVGTNTTEMTHNWKNAFESCSNNFKIYFTGTPEELLTFCNTVIAAGSNPKFTSFVVDGELNMDRVVFTTECEAFYYGEHDAQDDGICTTALACERCMAVLAEAFADHDNRFVIEYANGYMENGFMFDGCSRCSARVEGECAPLFTSKGVSAKAFGTDIGLVQGYGVNREAIAEYKAYAPDFDFGILAYANKEGTECTPKPGDDKVVDIVFDNSKNDFIEVMVVGIPEEYVATPVVLCIYVIDGEKIYYLNNGKTSESVVGVSYDSCK